MLEFFIYAVYAILVVLLIASACFLMLFATVIVVSIYRWIKERIKK